MWALVLLSLSIASRCAGSEGCDAGGKHECSAGDARWLPDDGSVSSRLGAAYGKCDFDRIDAADLSLAKFRKTYKEKRPVVLANFSFVGTIAERWQKASLLAAHGKKRVGVRVDNAIGDYSRTVPIEDVVANWARSGDFVLDFTHNTGAALVGPELRAIGDSWLKDVFPSGDTSTTVSLGPSGVGAAIHHHPESWLLLLHGQKHWFFYRPGAIEELPHAAVEVLGSPYALPQDGLSEILALKGGARPLQCTQQPGEVIYFPSLWEHGTINIGEAAGFALQNMKGEAEQMEYYAKLKHKGGHSRFARLALAANREKTEQAYASLYEFVQPRFWNAPLIDTYMTTLVRLYREAGNQSGIAYVFVERLRSLQTMVKAKRLSPRAAADVAQSLIAFAEPHLDMPRMPKVMGKIEKMIAINSKAAAA